MNKTYRFTTLWMMCLILLGCVSFTACENGDEEDTNQYTGGINLNVFGPTPVARGGVLRFLGSGMDKVTAVVIPGCDEITDIEVISNTEIRVTVPQIAQPGYVILKTPKGEITTKTKLAYTEPISLDALSPNPIKPGSVLTLTGEYLNLIKEIIFADNVIIANNAFTSQSRKEIKLVVPEKAQTGKIIISDTSSEDKDAIPNWVYSKEELNVILPSVIKAVDLTAKKPGNEIVITGKDFDLIKQILMPNGDEVEFKVTASDSGDKVAFVLPDNISNGAIVAVPASGIHVAIANIGVAVPSEVKATPASELRGGDVITLTGVNMELVSTVLFPNVPTAVEPDFKSATEVKVKMPAAAITGSLTLNTNSGQTVSVAIVTAKPKNIAYSTNSIPAGESLVITGSNLDVVSSIMFGGNVKVDVSPTTATSLTVKVPTTAETGILTLQMANGESVEALILTVQKPTCAYLPFVPASFVRGRIVELEIQNSDKLTNIQLGGAAVQYINDTSKGVLMLNVPSNLEGTYTLKLISSNGEISYNIKIVYNESIIWSGPLTITWGAGGRVVVPATSFSDITANTKMILYFDQKDQTWAQAQINDGSWGGIVFPEIGNGTLVPTDIFGWTFASRALKVTLTQAILDQIKSKVPTSGDFVGAGIIIQGSDLIFNKVTIVN